MNKGTILFSKEQIKKYNFIEDFMYGAEVEGSTHRFFTEQNSKKYMTICLIDRGKLRILKKGIEYTYEANQIMVLPSWTDISELICSDDFHALAIATGYEIIVDISRINNHLKNKFSPLIGREILDNIVIPEKEMEILIEDAYNIIGALGNKKHHFISELNYALFTVLITDLGNLIWEYSDDKMLELDNDISRSDVVFRQFMTLLDKHINKETNVAFYADKLCISQQYLSLIIKKHLGISIGQVISRARYEQGAKLLRNPEYSVQQVAMMLSFSDQSSFGKFFKKYATVSPTTYRKNIIKSLKTQVGNL